ncbi:MAG: carboxypeptidase-like regulatory domain-containing protein [Acidobacteriota bacterium]
MGEESSQDRTTEVTAGLTGTVTSTDGGVLPGVVIDAVHGPTGTTYQTLTVASGNYRIAGMRAGGPYTVTASLDGLNPQTKGDVYLELGEYKTLDFELSLASN